MYKRQIIVLNKNSSLKEIGEQYGISQNTVSTIIKRHRETGTLEARKRDGRPKTTTPRVDKVMKRELKKNPFATAAEVKSAVALAIDGPLDTVFKRIWACEPKYRVENH